MNAECDMQDVSDGSYINFTGDSGFRFFNFQEIPGLENRHTPYSIL